jgi:hypothetical protein
VTRLRLIVAAALAVAALVALPGLARAHGAHSHARTVASSAWD